MKARLLNLLLLVSALLMLPYAAAAKDAAESIGGYAAGCLKGSERIEDGTGYQMMRPSRQRNFGHPTLVHFIQSYAKKLKEKSGGVLLVGDLGEAKGGPMKSGHASHQVGLDVDFWFWFTPEAMERPLSEYERENISAVYLTDVAGNLKRDIWSHRFSDMLRIASNFSEVDRIFVNPSIKRQLCKQYSGESWLHKIRPWWGHDAHFHVRLKCPKGNALCEPQAHLPAGDGCDSSLIWWFGKEARLPETKADANRYVHRFDRLPKVCKEYLKQK
jgi:penicillin-insensitive murein endopeptidase